jgi:hypothetical protein
MDEVKYVSDGIDRQNELHKRLGHMGIIFSDRLRIISIIYQIDSSFFNPLLKTSWQKVHERLENECEKLLHHNWDRIPEHDRVLFDDKEHYMTRMRSATMVDVMVNYLRDTHTSTLDGYRHIAEQYVGIVEGFGELLNKINVEIDERRNECDKGDSEFYQAGLQDIADILNNNWGNFKKQHQLK